MRKVFFILLLSFVSLYARSDKVSSVPIPESSFLDLDGQECDEQCMKKLIEEEKYFSFMSKHKEQEDGSVDENYQKLSTLFGDSNQSDFSVSQNLQTAQARLAILVPQKSIQRYATSTINSIIAYLLAKDSNFDIEVFNSHDESPSSLGLALSQIRQKGYKVVIAPMTQRGARYLMQNGNDFVIFIPTINYKSMQNAPSNMLFGGIDYEEQVRKLLDYSGPKVATFSDGSMLGDKLNSFVAQNVDVRYEKRIKDSKKINLKYILKGNRVLQNASVFLNMPLVKSSLLSSQLRVYDIRPYRLLSTQINYRPMLLN